jgi:hypothetical protein
MKVFRYVGPARVDCLQNEEVCFSPPVRFNDPFDLRPVFAPVTDRHYLKRIIRECTRAGEFPVVGLPRAQRRKLEKQVGKGAIAHYRENAGRFADAQQGAFQQKLDKYFGVLCFSTINDNLLMWAHYGNSHRGFVLEFDTEDEQFKRLGDLHAIKYDTNRPVVDPVKQITVENYNRKSLEWQYEREYRLVRHLQTCERRSLAMGDFYFVRMPRSCVKAVYLGNRIEKPLAKKIFEIMADTPAAIYETELHTLEFGLVFKRIK